MEKREFYEHVERKPDAPEGERVVLFRDVTSNKDAPPPWNQLVSFRPLDRNSFAYKLGMADHRPIDEWKKRYRLIKDEKRIVALNTLYDELYPG